MCHLVSIYELPPFFFSPFRQLHLSAQLGGHQGANNKVRFEQLQERKLVGSRGPSPSISRQVGQGRGGN